MTHIVSIERSKNKVQPKVKFNFHMQESRYTNDSLHEEFVFNTPSGYIHCLTTV